MSMRILRKAAAATGAVALLGGAGVALAGPAQATAEPFGDPAKIMGEVVSDGELTVRHLPTTDSMTNGTLDPGQLVQLSCKIESQPVDGNKVWYKLVERAGWVAARYVDNLSAVPHCD